MAGFQGTSCPDWSTLMIESGLYLKVSTRLTLVAAYLSLRDGDERKCPMEPAGSCTGILITGSRQWRVALEYGCGELPTEWRRLGVWQTSTGGGLSPFTIIRPISLFTTRDPTLRSSPGRALQ